jgi:hypothetical protein
MIMIGKADDLEETETFVVEQQSFIPRGDSQ